MDRIQILDEADNGVVKCKFKYLDFMVSILIDLFDGLVIFRGLYEKALFSSENGADFDLIVKLANESARSIKGQFLGTNFVGITKLLQEKVN